MNDKFFLVYTTSAFTCPYCVKLKALMNIYGYDFYEMDITDEINMKAFKEQGFRQVPQVFLSQKDELKHIGGYSTTKDYLRMNFFTGHPRQDEIINELKELD